MAKFSTFSYFVQRRCRQHRWLCFTQHHTQTRPAAETPPSDGANFVPRRGELPAASCRSSQQWHLARARASAGTPRIQVNYSAAICALVFGALFLSSRWARLSVNEPGVVAPLFLVISPALGGGGALLFLCRRPRLRASLRPNRVPRRQPQRALLLGAGSWAMPNSLAAPAKRAPRGGPADDNQSNCGGGGGLRRDMGGACGRLVSHLSRQAAWRAPAARRGDNTRLSALRPPRAPGARVGRETNEPVGQIKASAGPFFARLRTLALAANGQSGRKFR